MTCKTLCLMDCGSMRVNTLVCVPPWKPKKKKSVTRMRKATAHHIPRFSFPTGNHPRASHLLYTFSMIVWIHIHGVFFFFNPLQCLPGVTIGPWSSINLWVPSLWLNPHCVNGGPLHGTSASLSTAPVHFEQRRLHHQITFSVYIKPPVLKWRYRWRLNIWIVI